jgi:hypothetical protein
VSEYQYYDFRTLDHPLTRNEMAALRSISTRAAITTTNFTNHYEWGDLKANPSKLLEKYCDAFVYVANWGTREFHMRRNLFPDFRLASCQLIVQTRRPKDYDRAVSFLDTAPGLPGLPPCVLPLPLCRDSPGTMALSNL